jgi:hypothetical protein
MSQAQATRISAMPDRFRAEGADGEGVLLGTKAPGSAG